MSPPVGPQAEAPLGPPLLRGETWSRRRAVLELIRLPNLFTAAADVVGGFIGNGGTAARWHVCAAMAVVSMALYAAGVSLNDVCDADRDRAERPERPIPSGRVSRSRALLISVVLFLAAIAAAMLISPTLGLTALAIAAAVVVYDTALKSTRLAPPGMGACRALNLAMGMLAAGHTLPAASLAAILLMGLYAASLTFFARDEASMSAPWRLGLGTIGIAGAIGGLFPFAVFAPRQDPGGAVLVLAVLLFVAAPGRRAMKHPSAPFVQAAVKRFVLGIVLFDAVVAWIGGGWGPAAIVASLLIPATVLARRFRVT